MSTLISFSGRNAFSLVSRGTFLGKVESIPIVEYPSVVSSSTPWFEHVFTRPQLKNFQTYVSGLILSPIHTISYMNSIFYAHSDQSALNNFITDSTRSDEKLEDARYRYILEGIRRCEKELSGDPHFYCTNKLDWDLYKILSVYARRWRVDVFYRDSKQNLGLEERGEENCVNSIDILRTLLTIF